MRRHGRSVGIRWRRFLVCCMLTTGSPALSHAEEPLTLENAIWSIDIEAETLGVACRLPNGLRLPISASRPAAEPIADLIRDTRHAHWRMPSSELVVDITLDGNLLCVNFTSARPGELVWPRLKPDPRIKACILPMFEGIYVPADDRQRIAFLAEHGPLNTTADLSMPFVGLDCGERSLTYILTNPFNNEVTFRNDPGGMAATLSHAFTRNHKVKECGFRVYLGAGSPIEPARRYRQWLIDTRQFITMREKIARTPEAAKLLGAAHIYLWGSGLMARGDVADFKALAREIKQQADAPGASVGGHLLRLMEPEARGLMERLSSMERVDDYTKGLLAAEVSRLLQREDFYDAAAWKAVYLPPEIMSALQRGITSLAVAERCSLNCSLLFHAFPGLFASPSTWGDGVSPKMLRTLAESGLDRLWLGVDGWEGLRCRPQTVQEARSRGYLIAPYDSYHSIHAPDEPGTWESAQFSAELYQAGAVIQADGTRKKGFKQKGYILSPIAARPHVEKRVTRLLHDIPANSLFIDCDAFGDLYDDYSELHPATQEDDMHARLSRMAWIRDTFNVVIGSEGGSAYAASTIHFAHGMMTPGIGWGDAEMNDRKSPYDLGAYYPPDGPSVFFKPVPLKEVYRAFYFDPRFRLPLYQAVFHDSVIATHQWGFGSLKFKNVLAERTLLELLYSVPPLYHLNLREFAKRRDWIGRHYAFFSPLHRETALLALTGFEWLTTDHRVQRTLFGDRIELIANFSDQPFTCQNRTIAPLSILARHLDSEKVTIFSCPAD